MRSLVGTIAVSVIAMACSSGRPTPAAARTKQPPTALGSPTTATSSVATVATAPPLVARGTFPIADFDGDGLADLAFTAVERPGEQCRQESSGKACWRPTTPSRMTLLVFLGRDRGTLTQTVELATGPDELTMGRAYEVGGVGDLDGDGRTEVAITFHPRGGGETLLLLRGTTSGLSAPYQSVPLPKLESHYWYSVRARPAGDVDGDGHPDVALGTAILHGGAGGKLRDLELVKPPGYSQHEIVMIYPVGDVTADAIADVVAVQKHAVYLVPGGGTSAPVRLAVPASYPNTFEAADLDGDGTAELISISSGSPLRLSTFSLSASGAAPGPTIDIAGDDVHGLAAADTDGSGIRDLHVVTSIGRVAVPCGSIRCTAPANLHVRTVRGGTTLSLDPRAPSPATLAFDSGPSIYLRALGDLDGDGIEELGIVEDRKLRATRSRGGTFELDARYSSTPTQIDVYTARAH